MSAENPTFPDISLVILAGGEARRLHGRNKALLELDGESLLARRIRLLEPLFGETVVVRGRDSRLPRVPKAVKVATDPVPGAGPLMGLYAGLRRCREDWAFVTGCDMPFFDRRLFGSLAARRDDHDAVIPRINGWYEPLFSLYHTRCVEAVEAHLDRRQIAAFYGSINALYVAAEEITRFDPEMRCFFNINTEDDLLEARRIEETHGPDSRTGSP